MKRDRALRLTLGVLLCSGLLMGAAGARPEGSRVLAFEDVRGDGNGINSQGEKGLEISQPTPGSHESGDIVNVTVTSESGIGKQGRVRLEMELAAPPEPGISYSFETDGTHCDRFYIAHLETVTGEVRDSFFCGDIRGEPKVTVRKNTLILTAKAPLLAGAVDPQNFQRPWAETRLATGSAGLYLTFPAIDSAAP